MSYGLIATLIVLVIVVGAITTKKCEAFLIAGSMVGALVLWKQNFLTEWVSTLEGVMSDEAYVILICGLFGSLVALHQKEVLVLQRLSQKSAVRKERHYLPHFF